MAVKLTIGWVKPRLEEEYGEYFENEFTYDYFKKRGFVFVSGEDLGAFLENGSLTTVTKQQLRGNYDNMTLDDADFREEMKDRYYAKSYLNMQRILTNKGRITLPAPIIIKFGSTYYGYAGNRRSNLAFNNNCPLRVWLVKTSARGKAG